MLIYVGLNYVTRYKRSSFKMSKGVNNINAIILQLFLTLKYLVREYYKNLRTNSLPIIFFYQSVPKAIH